MKQTRPSQLVDKKLKQMELTFRGVLCERLVDRKATKLCEKNWKNLQEGKQENSNWKWKEDKIIFNTRRMEKEMIEDMEWITTPDPELEIEIARNIRKKEEAYKKEKEINKYIVGNVVKEIIDMVSPLSMSANIIDILISRSVRLGKAGFIWTELAQDDQLRDDI